MPRYPLKIPCPVSTCADKVAGGWVCAKDGGTMYIDEDGDLSCESWAHWGKIIYWKFDCGKHNYQRYQSADYEGFTHALAIGMVHLTAAGADWLKILIGNLEKQYKK